MIIGYAIYWIGALADWYTTKRLLGKGGKEFNGFVRRIIDRLPWSTEAELFGLKALGFVALLFLDHRYGLPPAFFYALGALQAVAGLGNKLGWWGSILRRLRK